ncbi:MAG TPA: zinc ABC transporter substrate-binding protein [Azospirillaceae bacterium]|nr:zinc ABC transporter substrate-binding protein [Azospirillaceae bacterium]
MGRVTGRAVGGITRRVALLATFVAGVVAAGPVWAAPKYTVVATTGHVADLVRNVAGDRAQVVGLLGEGVDPHTYRLTRSDTAQLMRADIVFYNGLLLEGKMTDALVRVASSGKPVHAVTELIPEEGLLEPEGAKEQFDPHAWMDVRNWILAVEVVRDRLSAFDPDGASAYAVNAARYVDVLTGLDGYARRVLADIPEASRVLVTAHDAFNYLGRAYGLEVVGIQGLSTESEAGLKEIEALVDLLATRGIGAVFVETSVTDRNVRALIEGAAARGHKVEVGGSLYSDALGPPGTYEGTYVGMIDHNVTTIARALGGPAPAGGFQGRLAQVR